MSDAASNPPDGRSRLASLARLSPREQLEQLSARGDLQDELLSLIDAAAGLAMTDADEADAATALLVHLADEASMPRAQARARRSRARALAYAGRFEEALRCCAEAIEVAERHGQLDEAGRARLASMHALTETGRLADAIDTGEQARRVFLSLDEPALAARADINLGVIHQRRDELPAAVACFDRARPSLLHEPLMCGHLENNRGEALVALNDFARADEAFTAALAAFEEAGASLTAAIAEGNLADLAVRQGRLARGLAFFERARRRLESAGSPGHEARLLAEQAEAKALLGLLEPALRDYERALSELDRCHLPLEAARARAGMGLALLRLGRTAEAETALAAAATGFEELGHASARARVDVARAELLAGNHRHRRARALALRSLAVLEERPADAVIARHLLARLALERGELDLADAELAAAIATARDLDLAPALADLWQTRGRLERRRGRLARAVVAMTRAVEQVERVRGTLQAERFRAAYLGDRSSLYEELVLCLLDSDGEHDVIPRAFQTVEKSKSRVLLDQLRAALDPETRARSGDADADAAEAALTAEMEQLRAELNALYSRLADERQATARFDTLDRWRTAIREHERELEEIETRVGSVRGSAGLYAATVDLATVQQRLPASGTLVEYFIAGDELIGFVVDRDSALVRRNLASTEDVTERLRQFRFQVDRALRPGACTGRRAAAREADARRVLRDLHERLVAPLADRLDGTEHVVFVPHGPLHLVPFHALFDGEAHLVERHAVQYAPSASLFVHLADRPRETAHDGRALVVAVPDEAAPDIAAEARGVAASMPGAPPDLLVGTEAIAERVAELAPAADLLHLACHGRFDPDHPRGSGLRLGDRWLTVQDIYGLRLRAELVTLGACESAVNSVHAGDELVGLVRAFLAAGARAVLASQWRVHDRSTLDFMQTFYQRRNEAAQAECPPAVALRQAQLEQMRRTPHPAFWAPFILTGGAG